MKNQYEPVVELTRGGIVESVHFGALAMVDSSGKLLYSLGDPGLVTFPRSSMKPFQVLPFVERGGIDHFDMDEESLAIMCASHSGTDAHVAVLKRIHAKAGLKPEMLQCGVHPASDAATRRAMQARGEEPDVFRHNCSGKHSGMLSHAKFWGYPLENYLDMQNGLQQTILASVAEMCSVDPESMAIGIDGCSAPVFAMPLERFASAAARLVDPQGLEEKRAAACRRISAAMMHYPNMVAGPGRWDTLLMQLADGKIVSKGGAEGYQMMGIMPGALGDGSKGIGIAYKVADGDPNGRARNTLGIALLRALGFDAVVDHPDFAVINKPKLYNWRKLEIGEIRTVKPVELRL
jgi:L-asparaginase II